MVELKNRRLQARFWIASGWPTIRPEPFTSDHPKRQLEQIAEWLYGRALVMASSQFTIAACIAIR